MRNVAIIVEEEPTEEQKKQLHLLDGQTLFGLYEGIPLTNRSGNYGLIAPDKITIFKKPLEYSATTVEDLENKIKRTVWHEIAHHYGLNHENIEKIATNHTD